MDTTKIYFKTELEAMAYSAAEALYRGCSMDGTVYWYQWYQEKDGWYIEVEK
jgi:hypothetical protein